MTEHSFISSFSIKTSYQGEQGMCKLKSRFKFKCLLSSCYIGLHIVVLLCVQLSKMVLHVAAHHHFYVTADKVDGYRVTGQVFNDIVNVFKKID